MLDDTRRRQSSNFNLLYPEGGPYRRELYTKHLDFFALGKLHNERALLGGNRTGKTSVGAYEATVHATGLYPDWWQGHRFNRPNAGWVAGDTSKTVKEIIQQKLIGKPTEPGTGMIPEELIVNRIAKSGVSEAVETLYVRHKSGGTSIITFKSYDQKRISFQGTSQDWIWCLAEGQLVQMADGTLKPIEKVKAGDRVLSIDERGEAVSRRVLGAADRGPKECIRVLPKHGTPVVCTTDHEIYWGYRRKSKAAAEKATRVAQPRSSWWPENTEDRSEAWYIWAALVVAEGHVARRKVTNGSIHLMEKAVKALPTEARVRRQDFKNGHVPDWILTWPDFWAQWPKRQASEEKEIPGWVFTSSKERAALFLRWLYMGDGWANGHTVGYATTSTRLAEQLVVLLNRLGIRASTYIRRGARANWREQFWVQITRSSDVLAFLDLVGIEGKRAATDKVRIEANRRERASAARGQRLAKHGRREFTDRNAGARRRTSKVRSITPVGERRVYDLTVENEHRFLCGTSLVSNCDEEVDEAIYTECCMRTMKTSDFAGGIVWLTFTPLMGISEVVQLYLPDGVTPSPDRALVLVGWADIPHLDEKEKAERIKKIPPYQRDARTKGIPQLGAGAIYPLPEEDIIVKPFEIPKHYRRAYGLDVGGGYSEVSTGGTGCVWGAQNPDTQVTYLYEEYFRAGAEPSVHAAAIKARGEWIPGVIDPSARGRSQIDGREMMQMYIDLGLNLTMANNAVEAGIYSVWDGLSSGQLKVFSTLQRWRAERNLYRRDSKGRIVKERDHLMDGSRYLYLSGRDLMVQAPVESQGTASGSVRRGPLGFAR